MGLGDHFQTLIITAMPIRKENYPPNWKEISWEVRTESDWCCVFCGARSNSVIKRHKNGSWMKVEKVRTDEIDEWEDTALMGWSRLRFFGLTRIVLTVAHLDRDSTNNDRKNLAALCQRCHLNHDREAQHIPSRRYGRDHTRKQQTKLKL